MKNTKKLVLTALMCALTCVATMIIKIPTPTMGYIHPGDALVLLCGILLGPVTGGLAAGVGSMFADVFSGYLSYAPATFVIKAVTAIISGLLTNQLIHLWKSKKMSAIAVVIGGICGEAFMVIGYFVFEIFLMAFTTGDGFTTATLTAGIASAGAGIPFNLVQGIFGIMIATILYPLVSRLNFTEEA